MKRIIIVGGLHGDEPTGIAVAKYFQKNPHKGITGIIVHNQAISQKKRFLETDLNRSFAPIVAVSLEEQLAESLKKKIIDFDYVLDIHNTKGDFTTCAITTINPNRSHLQMAKHFGFERVVIMPPSGSLIAQSPQNSISLEIALNETKKYSVAFLVDKIKKLHQVQPILTNIIQYSFVKSIKSKTLQRVKIRPNAIRNFVPLRKEQKKLLHLPLQDTYLPIFAKKKYGENIAFELIKERK